MNLIFEDKLIADEITRGKSIYWTRHFIEQAYKSEILWLVKYCWRVRVNEKGSFVVWHSEHEYWIPVYDTRLSAFTCALGTLNIYCKYKQENIAVFTDIEKFDP